MKTRMLKAACAPCGYTVRAARKWLGMALPLCPLCGERMASPEYEAVLEAELAAWEADGGESMGAMAEVSTLSDRWVTTRALHSCASCREECQHGERMRYRAYVIEGELYSEYTCFSCDAEASGRKARGGARALARA